VKATPVAAALLALDRVMVSVEVPPRGMIPGEKAFAADGGGVMFRVALAGLTLLAPPETVSPPAGMVLTAEETAVTGTVTVQVPLAGMVPPESPTKLPPLTPVAVPPAQVVEGVPALLMVPGR